METLRVGVIGLGCRGYGLMYDAIVPQENARITAICDLYPDRVEEHKNKLEKIYEGHEVVGFSDYRELLASGLVDVVIVSTSWEAHVNVTCAALEAGIPVGCEVGGAYSVDDCYRLVRTWEKTRTPFMFLENCNYDRRETSLFAMIKAGLFGKVVACDGGYMHDLRGEVCYGKENRHYRLRNYLARNGENYPTHELGPIMRMLDINRGNRMVSLVSVASGAFGMNAYMQDKDPSHPTATAKFHQGDVITTVITCEGGETITLRLDTCLPRYYSRGITVHGTKALYTEDNDTLFIDGEHQKYDWDAKALWGNFRELSKPYQNEDWNEVDGGKKVAGHGGMDYFMMRDFFTRLIKGEEPAIDVYDAAAMMVITPLSQQSIAMGGAPVAIPDFTGGYYLLRK